MDKQQKEEQDEIDILRNVLMQSLKAGGWQPTGRSYDSLGEVGGKLHKLLKLLAERMVVEYLNKFKDKLIGGFEEIGKDITELESRVSSLEGHVFPEDHLNKAAEESLGSIEYDNFQDK
jgi:hypothetical protein